MTFGGVFIVILKWFRGPAKAPETDDVLFHEYLTEIVKIEKEVGALEDSRKIESAALAGFLGRLNAIHVAMLERYSTVMLKIRIRLIAALPPSATSFRRVGSNT